MSKKVVPAVFFQKNLNAPVTARKKPARLELLETELAKVAGGIMQTMNTDSCSGGCLDDCQDALN